MKEEIVSASNSPTNNGALEDSVAISELVPASSMMLSQVEVQEEDGNDYEEEDKLESATQHQYTLRKRPVFDYSGMALS